jgi:hypothetical protein
VVHPLIKLSRTVTDSLSVNSHNAIESDLSEIMLAHDIEKKMITMSVLFNILVRLGRYFGSFPTPYFPDKI